jgi:hypothetical protein
MTVNKFLPFVLLFFSSSCFATTIIPGCAPDIVKVWESKTKSEFHQHLRYPKTHPIGHFSVNSRPLARLDDGIVHIWVEKRGLIINEEIIQTTQWSYMDQRIIDAISESKPPELGCSTNRIFEIYMTFSLNDDRF